MTPRTRKKVWLPSWKNASPSSRENDAHSHPVGLYTFTIQPAMTVKPVPTVGVVGSGTMGSGIALVALSAGCEVYLQDAYIQMLEKASAYIQSHLEKKEQ